MKDVSVVIPSYNREKSIVKCINSALMQGVADIEVIVVDDGSTDGTEAAVKSIDDARVVYIKQKNQGANVARNVGLEAATGRYIALLDSDDQFCEGHLLRSIEALDSDSMAVAFGRIIVDRGEGVTFLKPPRGPRFSEPISEYLSCDKGFVQTSTLVIPNALGKQIRYLDWLPYGQDVDYACRIAHAGYHFIYFETPGAIWADKSDSKRISAKSDPHVRSRWAVENRELLTDKAYLGFMGWRVAKAYAEHGQTLKGLRLFLEALVKGAYPASHALIVFSQIVLAGGAYRRLADRLHKTIVRRR